MGTPPPRTALCGQGWVRVLGGPWGDDCSLHCLLCVCGKAGAPIHLGQRLLPASPLRRSGGAEVAPGLSPHSPFLGLLHFSQAPPWQAQLSSAQLQALWG